MNKAFVREEEFDTNSQCPRCGTAGVVVFTGPLDTHLRDDARTAMGDTAYFCNLPRCEVAYFSRSGVVVTTDQLTVPVYPKDYSAPLCACFGLSYEDVEADIQDGQPTRIRALLAKSKSPEARCGTLAPDGKCCMPVVQELYLRLRSQK
jgi:hypothetical protein